MVKKSFKKIKFSFFIYLILFFLAKNKNAIFLVLQGFQVFNFHCINLNSFIFWFWLGSVS